MMRVHSSIHVMVVRPRITPVLFPLYDLRTRDQNLGALELRGERIFGIWGIGGVLNKLNMGLWGFGKGVSYPGVGARNKCNSTPMNKIRVSVRKEESITKTKRHDLAEGLCIGGIGSQPRIEDCAPKQV